MAQTFHPVTPVECTPGSAGSWQDVDIDDYIADLGADVTGVLLHYENTYTSSKEIGVRKNGSTDDRVLDVRELTHAWAAVGVDASHIFECEVEDKDDIDVYIVGYTTTGVTFATNATEKTPTQDGWRDEDCSGDAPSATGLIFEQTSVEGSDDVGLRKGVP